MTDTITSKMAIKLPYGLKEGVLVHINEVQENGLKCNCICSACNARLVARKGDKKIHHFAHYNSPECKYAVQTALHIAAKDIIARQCKFTIPGYSKCIAEEASFDDIDIYADIPEQIDFFSEKALEVSNVYLEKRTNDFVPDIILEIGGKKLIVEIAVTHFIDKSKYQKIVNQGISVVEIDLSQFKNNFDLHMLEELVVTGTQYKKWIYNVVGEAEWQKWKAWFFDLNEKEKIQYQWKQEEIQREDEEERKKQRQAKREIFYLTQTKKIQTHTINYIDDDTGELLPKTISHVSPCPEQKKVFEGKYYANIDTHCIRCSYFRGYRDERKEIVCLGSYYKDKKSHQDFD